MDRAPTVSHDRLPARGSRRKDIPEVRRTVPRASKLIRQKKRKARGPTRAPLVDDRLQFERKIASISVRTCSSVCARAIAISFTISDRAVSSMRRSPNESCLSVLRR